MKASRNAFKINLSSKPRNGFQGNQTSVDRRFVDHERVFDVISAVAHHRDDGVLASRKFLEVDQFDGASLNQGGLGGDGTEVAVVNIKRTGHTRYYREVNKQNGMIT